MSIEETHIHQPIKIPNGTLLLGSYEIEQFLNSGAMAWAYLGIHRELNSKHVIKVIKPGFEVEGIDVLELFKREAQTLRSIRHDAIVSYDGFQRDEKYGLCMVMEYVEGPSLKQLLQERPLTVEEVWRFRNRLADGLAAVHAKGVYHRDLAPDNIILPDGNVAEAKLIDFGIAKRRDLSTGTVLGSIYAGKLSYVAPEQFGLFGGEIGSYSDIYSFGLILAGAATGKPLNMGNSMETAYQARLKTPDLSSVPVEFRDQLTSMLQPNPADRPQDIAELLDRWPDNASKKKASIKFRTAILSWIFPLRNKDEYIKNQKILGAISEPYHDPEVLENTIIRPYVATPEPVDEGEMRQNLDTNDGTMLIQKEIPTKLEQC
jgi:eukaryotic-like serine/threonine-protein kinase